MHSPGSYSEEVSDEKLIFDPKNRADKISIILFWDYGNAVLPLTSPFLVWKNENEAISLQMLSFLQFYWAWGPHSWILNNVGWDVKIEDLEHHSFKALIEKLDTMVHTINLHLQEKRLIEASQEANRVIELIRASTPQYSIKHNS